MKKRVLFISLLILSLFTTFSYAQKTSRDYFYEGKAFEKEGKLFSALMSYSKMDEEITFLKDTGPLELLTEKLKNFSKISDWEIREKECITVLKDFEQYMTENCIYDFNVNLNYEKGEKNRIIINLEKKGSDLFSKCSEVMYDNIFKGYNWMPYYSELDSMWPFVSIVNHSLEDSNSLIEGIATVEYRGIKYNPNILNLYEISFNIVDSSGKILCPVKNRYAGSEKPLVINNPSQNLINKLEKNDYKIEITSVNLLYGKSSVDISELIKNPKELKKHPLNFEDCKIITGFSAGKYATNPDKGKVLNIFTWNEEFADRFNSYYGDKIPKDVTVNFTVVPNMNNEYQNMLDEALLNQSRVKADDKIDIFLVEADYALKYVDTPYTLDIKKDVGLTDEDLSKQFKYTQDIVTDSKGKLKGVTWQACPGGFIYRRSYAKEVLGTDDPEQVQKLLSTWNKFNTVAAKMKAAGYYMLSGYDDSFRAFADNRTQPWVKGNKIIIDPQIQAWIKQTKEFADKGYNKKANLWSAESMQGMMADGGVFGYFGPAWFSDYCIPHDEGSAFGDWGFCKGPQGFFWGGSWICVAAGCDNLNLVKDILKTLTCDAEVMATLAIEKYEFANNEKAMSTVATSDFENDFFAGQNPYKFYIDSAKSIDMSNVSMYDQGMNEKIQSAMKDYFEGLVDIDTAWDNFYTSVMEVFPNLYK